jgi:CDP-diacylglycerol--serine O-phosphatidyltransferase
MKKVYLLTNGITAFGLTCGLFVIFRVCMLDVGEGNFQTLQFSAIALMLAAFADLLDGAVARAMKAESDFGEAFDSLADAVSFGVAPSVITLKAVSISPGTDLSFFLTAAAMIFSVCGILRLVRFTVDTGHVKEDKDLLLAHRKHFTGLPIPAGAAALVSINLLLVSPWIEEHLSLTAVDRAWILIAVMPLLGYFMVSRWRFPSLKTLQVRVASFQLVFATALSTVILFYGFIYHFALVFFALSWAYVASAGVTMGYQTLTGKVDSEGSSED